MESLPPANAWLKFRGSSQGDLIERLTLGHIHDTYLVSSSRVPVAILQRLNQRVFPDPRALIANAEIIEPHLRSSMRGLIAERIATLQREPCFIDSQGDYWRAFKYIAGSRTLASPQCETQCFAAGAAFGRFQYSLRKVREGDLRECIEGFQDLAFVMMRFRKAGMADNLGRLSDSKDVADRLSSLETRVPPLSGPLGVIHGDGKFNNLLFEESGDEVVAVLDLDTVMWHHRALDFGDLARAGSVRGGEVDIHAEIDIARLSAFAQGFRGEVADLVAQTEPLVDALLHVTFMLALRFYTDHLNGDTYFRVNQEGDNLRRAQGQCALLEQCLRREAEIRSAIRS